MIVNIPLQIDEAAIEGKLKNEYEKKVVDEIEKRIQEALSDRYGLIYDDSASSARANMRDMIRNQVDKWLYNNRDEILDEAAKRLYERAVRTKKIREVKNKIEEVQR